MPFLTLAGTDVACSGVDEPEMTLAAGGLVDRMASGRLAGHERYRKREWKFKTPPMTRAQATTLRALIEAWPAYNATGDAIPGGLIVSVLGSVEGIEILNVPGGPLLRIEFRLQEV